MEEKNVKDTVKIAGIEIPIEQLQREREEIEAYGIYPMLAKKINPQKIEDYFINPEYGAQIKFNGTGVFIRKIFNRITMWVARSCGQKTGNIIRHYPELHRELLLIPCVTLTLHAELTFHDKITMKEHFENAFITTKNREKYKVYLRIHDIIECDGEEIWAEPYFERILLIEKILSHMLEKELIHALDTHLRPAYFVKSEAAKRALYTIVLKNNLEGIIFKRICAPYNFGDENGGSRSDACIKLKPMYTENQDTADCIIIGCTEGLGRNAETFGALILAQLTSKDDLIYVGKTAGMTDAERKRLYTKIMAAPKEYVEADFWKKFFKGSGIPKKKIKRLISPNLTCEIKFGERKKRCYVNPNYLRERTEEKQWKQCRVNGDQ